MNDKETLEEVAKSHAIYELENNYKPTKESFKLACKRNFIRGAKWQAERMYSEEELQQKIDAHLEVAKDLWLSTIKEQKRMYSEEEVGELLYNVIGEYGKHYGIMIDGKMLNDLFEQFKK